MSKYKVSVITPIHNVDVSVFKSCAKSMLEQSIGFENVQWIIVLHNCNAKCSSAVKRLLKKYKNAEIYELNNEVHTPASPRNFALKKVKTSYIGFLDADDMYTKNCLEVAYKEIVKAKAQILSFRRDHYMENENLRPITEKIKWNQAEDKIIVNPKTCNQFKLFSETFYMITSKLFDANFLKKNKLAFDDKSYIGTDYLFTLKCFKKANRICILPKFIGYTYYINSQSIAQHKMKGDAEFMRLVKSAKTSIDLHDKHGIPTDSNQGHCFLIAYHIMNNPNISYAARAKAKDIFSKTLDNFKLQQPDKFYTQRRLLERYWISKIVLTHPDWPVEKFHQILNCGLINLLTILKTNQNSDFGEKYGFKNINSVARYQSKVPVSTSNSQSKLINLQNKIGETNILCCTHPTNYIKKNNGEILMTNQIHIEPYMEALNNTLINNTTLFVAKYSNSKDKKSTDNVYIRSFNDVMLRNYFWNYREATQKNEAKLTSDDAFYFMNLQKKEFYKSLVKDAISNKNLSQIIALNTKELFYVFKIMKECFPKVNFKKAWPNLKRICVFDNKLTKNAKTKICEFFNISYCGCPFFFTEESILGKFDEKNGFFVNYFGDSFIELVDKNEKNCDPIELAKAKIGDEYRLAITNSAGLYRYFSDYFVKIIKNESGIISFKFI